ncbi:MAG: PucR family transcriptional regulator, partial [Chloroflexia bacterium]|nr:PucR family transcriptional regulator [Chloroflexia bacterium]
MSAGEITLRDLVAWEPRLRATGQIAALDREVDWVVTARASDPALPTLRGGELILLPRRVFSAIGRPLPLLLDELAGLAGQPVAGVVVDVEPPVATALPVLTVEAITPELEGELNRLLTTRHGDLL